MKKEELQRKQDELDNEEIPCSKCGRMEKWGFLREWGDCNECVSKYFKEKDMKWQGGKLK